MIDKRKSFSHVVGSLDKTEHIPSIPIFESKIDFKPKFSIVIPTYNRTDLLKEALDSALNQIGNEDYEVIVIDNNSVRNCQTEKLLSLYENERLSYYKNSENLGMVGNWNRSYSLAKGEWVVMLHDDDLLYDDYIYYINIVTEKISKNIDVIYVPYTTSLTDEEIKCRDNIAKFKFKQLKSSDFLWGNIIGPPVGMCLKRKIFEKSVYFENKYYPSIDYAFYVHVAKCVNSIKLSEYPLGIYRIGENESMHENVLISFVEKDNLIKDELLNDVKCGIVKRMWIRYFRYFDIEYLNRMKCLLCIDERNIKNLLDELCCKLYLFDKMVFFIMNLYKKIYFKMTFRKVSI